MTRLITAVLVLLGGEMQPTLHAPSLKDVLRRIGAYVVSYGERASVVVATEHYTQDSRAMLQPPLVGIARLSPSSRSSRFRVQTTGSAFGMWWRWTAPASPIARTGCCRR